MSYSYGLLHFKSQTAGQGGRGAPGVGFNLTADGNYDMVNKKLENVAEGTNPTDAITLKQLGAVDFETITRDIDLHNTYNVINRDVVVSRKESVFPMQTHLDMGNQFLYNVKTRINNDQGANKSYVDQHVAKAGNTMSGDLNIGVNSILNLPPPQENNQPTTKTYVDNGFLKLSGGLMTGNLDMRNNKIFNLPTPTGDAQRTPKPYVDTNFLKLTGGHITGIVSRNTQSTAFVKRLLNYQEMRFGLWRKGTHLSGKDSI